MIKKTIMSKLIYFIFILFVVQVFLMTPVNKVNAGLWEEQEGIEEIGSEAFGEVGDPTDPREIIAEIIKIFLTFLALIFLILIISAGYKWMTSQGNEDKIKEAKSQLTNAIIGIIIVLSAYAITTFVIECMLKITEASLWGCN